MLFPGHFALVSEELKYFTREGRDEAARTLTVNKRNRVLPYYEYHIFSR